MTGIWYFPVRKRTQALVFEEAPVRNLRTKDERNCYQNIISKLIKITLFVNYFVTNNKSIAFESTANKTAQIEF